jgi:LmbE family N-acetylglucosaminyl deacetylase
MKSQIPNPKSQIPVSCGIPLSQNNKGRENSNNQSSNIQSRSCFGHSVIGIWYLFVIWNLLFGIFSACFAQSDLNFTAQDRVLIIAPHPDDEIIASGGVIQKALNAKAAVKVAYFTNGDYNEISFLFYKKQLALFRSGFVTIGKIRQREAVSATASLGITGGDIIFLGYPDRFTEAILLNFWNKENPFHSLLTHLNKVPYESALSYGAPYIGGSILNDFKNILSAFKPTKIFVSSPQDTNPDHRSAFVYLNVALLDLRRTLKDPVVYLYLVHKINWPSRQQYFPGEELETPPDLESGDKNWIKLVLTDNEIKNKYKALFAYTSQLSFKKSYLLSFVRKNELFYTQPQLVLTKNDRRYPRELYSKVISDIYLRRDPGFLYLKISFYKNVAPQIWAHIHLLGYRQDRNFSEMPKLFLRAKNKRVIAYANRKAFRIPGAELISRGNELFLKIPLWSLGNPEYIFSRIILMGKVFSVYVAPWRLLVI